MGVATTSSNNAVGRELASVLPQDNNGWYKRAHLVKLNLVILSLCQLSSSNGFDGSIMNGLQSLPLWHDFMHNPTGAWLGFVNAVYFLGMMVCAPIASEVSNKYGRKRSVWIGYIVIVAGVALQTAAPNDKAFIVARLLVGGSSAFFSNSVPLLINEIAYPTHRGILSAVFNTGYYVGSIIAACATFATRNYGNSWAWRVPSLLQILLPIVALPGFWYCPESPRFLIDKGDIQEAGKIISIFHAGGDDNSPLVNYEMLEIETAIATEKTAKHSSSYLDMSRTKGNRWRLGITVSLAIFSQWSGNGVVSYYLSLVLSTVGITGATDQLLINLGLQIWNLLFSVAAAFSVDKLGRRVLFLASASTMLISYIVVTGLSGSFAQTNRPATGIAVVPFLFCFFAGYDIALTPLLVAYPCEIWPYTLRTKGITVAWMTAVSAIFFNTFVNPIALEAIGWKYYIVFVVVLIIFYITAYLFYPETRGHSLEQMAIIFDGADAAAMEPEQTKERAVSVSHEVSAEIEAKTGTVYHKENVLESQ
ncbi:general substrate transporter [Periconia macrospinosa]|uniref:General substrate transporter n=1 Tax=Periconia macrospinosa TaxID=97972 RepID=A0A2V1DBQ2_9PLEO|nr:general substrate transporter [Periconia macrospinosa]